MKTVITLIFAAALLESCSTDKVNDAPGIKVAAYQIALFRLTARAGLATMESLPVSDERLRFWLVDAGDRESAICYEITPSAPSAINVFDPYGVLSGRIPIKMTVVPAVLWEKLLQSGIWEIQDGTKFANSGNSVDGSWIVVERRRTGLSIERIGYNNPWGGQSQEQRKLLRCFQLVQDAVVMPTSRNGKS